MNPRKYSLTYFASILLIGALFLAYYFSLQSALKLQRDHASIINRAGLQRTQSQRVIQLIFRLNLESSTSDGALRQELKSALYQFEKGHLQLISPDPNQAPNPLNDERALRMFSEIEPPLQRLLSNARAVAFNGEWEPQRLGMLIEDQALFQNGMTTILSHYEQISNRIHERVRKLNAILLLSCLSLLGLLTYFVLVPLVREVRSYFSRLQSLNADLQATNNELAQTKGHLNRQVQAMEAITNALNKSALVSVTDKKGRIVRVNDIFCSVSGFREEELIGQDHSILSSGYHTQAFWKDLWATISKGAIWRGLVKNQARDGSFYWVDSTVTPMKDERGNVKAYLSIRQEVTQRMEYEEALKEAKERAEAANIAKSTFLANMSHEIRTPLNSVIGFTELLLKTRLNDTQRQYMGLIHQSGNILLDLINDILDFSKIEAGKLELSPEKTDLWELVSQVADVIKYKVNEKGIEFILNLSPDLPRYAWVDPIRIRQILVNLVSNAVKFTEEGEIEIGINALPGKSESGQQGLRFMVRDTGIGIAKERQAKILEAFTQEDSSTTRKFGGTGLGLTISNKLLKLMGSRLEIQSQLNIGSTFSFVGFFKTENGKPRQWKGLSDINKVLLVDDNPNNLRILEEMLHLQGIRAVTATNGITALERLKAEGSTYDAVITDYHMPYMDGLEVVRRIRLELNLAAHQLPVILLHSSSEDQLIRKASRELAIAQQINKPITIRRLFDSLSGLHQHQPPLPAATEEPDSNFIAAAHLKILVVDDNRVNVILAKELVNQAFEQVEVRTASNGKEAVTVYQEYQPDLILMDVQMPIMNGYEATRVIRRLENQRTPIIALTAGTIKGERERCLDAGMDDYLSKPISFKALKKALQHWVHSPNHSDTLTSTGASNQGGATSMELPRFNRDSLLERFGGNEAVISEVVAGIWQTIKSGELRRDLDALKADLANEAPPKVIRAHAHKIKGTGLTASFDSLSALAWQLEQLTPFQPEVARELQQKIEEEVDALEKMAANPA